MTTQPLTARRTDPTAELRRSLSLDAIASAALAALLLVGAAPLDGALGIPTGWLLSVGAALVAWAVALHLLATRPQVPAGAGWAVVVLNAAWVAASAAVLLAGAFDLTGLGTAVVVVQAAAVVVLVELQVTSLRRGAATGD